MKQYFGMSQTGNLKEAAQGVHAPGLLILMSNADQFEAHVTELESLFPGVPSIGCIGMSYSTRVVEKGVGLVAFYDNVTAVANVLEQASTMPVKYIERMEQDLKNVHASSKDTVCIDLCTGNDACVLTTIHSILGKAGIPLVGGTGDGGKVSVNGTVYEDADVYAFVKNNGGKVAVYKENLYKPMPGYRFQYRPQQILCRRVKRQIFQAGLYGRLTYQREQYHQPDFPQSARQNERTGHLYYFLKGSIREWSLLLQTGQ